MPSLLLLSTLLLVPLSLLYLRTRRNSPPSPPLLSPTSTPPLPSLILPSTTAHKRLLPEIAKHVFSYPLVYLGLDVEELESGRLDVPGWLQFGDVPLQAVLTISRKSYLANPKPQPLPTTGPSGLSLRAELLNLLSSHGLDKDSVGRIWLVTMPSYLGKAGINPLSVWFVYDRGVESAGETAGEGKLDEKEGDSDDDWVIEGAEPEPSATKVEGIDTPELNKGNPSPKLIACVLEVHNTFGERHIYVLPTSPAQTNLLTTPKPAHHHAWIFPRSFHVSPFNDRSGFYRLDLVDPFLASTATPPPLPKVLITLHLLTPSHQPKIYASLSTLPTTSLRPPRLITSYNIVSQILLRQPLDLLLTTPRIMRQAWTLHYVKKLLVFPRPELSRRGGDEGEGAGVVAGAWNKAQEDGEGVGRSIGWKGIGMAERVAERIVLGVLERRVREIGGVVVEIAFSNPSRKVVVLGRSGGQVEKSERVLKVYTTHPRIFTELLVSQTGEQFLQFANTDRHSHVSDEPLFLELLRPSPSSASTPLSIGAHSKLAEIAGIGRRVRVLWLLGFALLPIPPHILFPLIHHSPTSPHYLPTSSLWDALMICWIVWGSYAAARAEEAVMWCVGARFVDGRGPWEAGRRLVDGVWGRGQAEKGSVGSVIA